MTASLGDVFGGLAFFLSIYATIKTIKFNERQKALIEAQEKLTNLQLTKEANELESSKKADVSANIVNIGNNKYKLKVLLTDQALNIIRERYADFGPTLTWEKLAENHGLLMSL